MEILSKHISEEFLYGIGWTIFHSLWIGALISLLLFIALNILRGNSAKLRYNVSLGALISMVIILTVVFIHTLNTAEVNTLSRSSQSIYTTREAALFLPGSEGIYKTTDVRNEISHSIISFLNHNYDKVTLFWLAGILFMAFRFTGGLVYSRRLRKRYNRKSISRFLTITDKLKNKLGIRRKVEVIESLISKVPITTGFLKPVILLPIGALSGIPYNQLEAIIAHELAHIKRNDYLVNIIQSLIEIILFYHPAVWWMSSMIRTEREIACDEIALELSDKKLTYIKALLSISNLKSEKTVSAVAFTGNRNNLLNRIIKITKMKEPKLNSTDKWSSALMSLIIIAGVLVLSGFTSRTGIEHSDKQVANISESINPITDQGLQNSLTISQDTNKLSGKVTKEIIDPVDNKKKDGLFTFKDGKLTSLIIDGREISESDYHLYSDLIEETKTDMADALADMEDSMVDLEDAMQEIKDIDFEEMEMDIQEALAEIEELDMERMEMDIAEALEEINEINIKEIEYEMQKAITEIEESLQEIEEINMKELEFEMQKALEEIKNLDVEQMKLKMMESMEGVKEVDLDKIMKEMEKSIEQIKESLKDIEIDQRKNFEIQKENFNKQKEQLEKQLIEIQKQETQKNDQIKSEKNIKKEKFN